MEEATTEVHRRRDIRSHERRIQRGTPQGALGIPTIEDGRAPGVFIEVELALGYCVTAARLEGGIHFPDAMQLPAHQIWIGMPLAQYLSIAVRHHCVVVVGN